MENWTFKQTTRRVSNEQDHRSPHTHRGFPLYCLAEGNQPTTIRWYMGKLNIFQPYLKDHDLPINGSQITTTHLRKFLVHLHTEVKADQHNPNKPTRDEGLSPQTIQGYARTLKAFFS